MEPPVLYIIMRNDLASLNPGKAMIQAAHAANLMVKTCRNKALLAEWEGDRGFGTGVSLEGNITTIGEVLKVATDFDVYGGMLHDPSYPIRDGRVTHMIPLDTCAFIFARDDECKKVISLVKNKLGTNLGNELNWHP